MEVKCIRCGNNVKIDISKAIDENGEVRCFYALIVVFILDILKNSLLHVKGLSAGHAKTINICNVLVSIL